MSYVIRKFKEGSTYTDGYVIRWKSNDQCLMADATEELFMKGLITIDVKHFTDLARKEETAAFLEEWAASQGEPSDEELCEMAATFGPGAQVVNIITGRVVQL